MDKPLTMTLVEVNGDLRAFGRAEVIRELLRKTTEEEKRSERGKNPNRQ